LLTDTGLTTISNHCPKLQSLTINHQRKCTMSGLRALLQQCPDLVELEASDLRLETHDVAEVLATSHKLLYFLFDSDMQIPDTTIHDKTILQNAVKRTKGRVVLGSMGGLRKIKLSREHQRNQDDSKNKIEEAFQNNFDPKVYNIWDGIV